jgi:undecaprenyl-diphosphooligosaccharide---protein glycotransferase
MLTNRHSECGFPARDAGAGSGRSAGSRPGLWLGLVLVIGCAVYASHLRLAQLSAWKSEPEQYIASGVPMMTTLDAYYSLRLARMHAAGTFVPHGPAPARHYSRPEPGNPSEWYGQREPKTLPLLSRALAVVSPLFGGDIDRTGLVLSPLLSSLFMIPLFLCCWRLGVPAAGLMGGLVATFCIEYYQRTGVGWVDTDSLNLFFPWTVSCVVLAMHGGQRRETLLLLSAAAGAVLYVFFLWYSKPGLTLLYVGALAVHLRLSGVSWRRTILCVATLVIFANPLQFGDALDNLAEFAMRYLLPSAGPSPHATPGLRFPEVWATISEARPLQWTDALKRTLGRADMAAIGLVAVAPFALWRWRSMAPLGPVLLLGMLALLSSRRFIPYLAPFVGIGWGLIVSLLTRGVLSRVGAERGRSPAAPDNRRTLRLLQGARSAVAKPGIQVAVAYLAVVGLFTSAFAPVPAREIALRPAVPAPVFRDLQILAERLPVKSRMWTWWDLGFAIVDTTGFGVYHDGAAQYTPQTNLVAASFVSPDPHVLHDVIGFVDREGNRGIRRLAGLATDFDDLLMRMRGFTAPRAAVPIYVLYTPDMLLKYQALRTLGTSGPAAASGYGSFGIRRLECERIAADVLHCAGQTLDLRAGSIDRRGAPWAQVPAPARLRRAVLVESGRVLRQREYAEAAQLTVEIVIAAGAVKAVYLLDEPAFESNLNQMFVLGRFDPARFEEAFNDFPYARAFRVLAPPGRFNP